MQIDGSFLVDQRAGIRLRADEGNGTTSGYTGWLDLSRSLCLAKSKDLDSC